MKKLYLVLLVLVLTAIAAGVWFWRGRRQMFPPPAVEQQYQSLQPSSVSDTPATVSTADWKTYENKKYGYKMELPSSWGTISEYDGRYNREISQYDIFLLGTNNGVKAEMEVYDDTNSVKHTIGWYIKFFLKEPYIKQSIKISGLDGVSVCVPINNDAATSLNRCVYLIEYQDKLFVMNFYENNEITRHILSTLKFLK